MFIVGPSSARRTTSLTSTTARAHGDTERRIDGRAAPLAHSRVCTLNSQNSPKGVFFTTLVTTTLSGGWWLVAGGGGFASVQTEVTSTTAEQTEMHEFSQSRQIQGRFLISDRSGRVLRIADRSATL